MKLYPIYKISQEEAESILSIIFLAEYIDKQASASPLVRELRGYLEGSCGELQQNIFIEDPLLDSKEEWIEFIENTLSKIKIPHLKQLLYPISELIAEYDQNIVQEEKDFLIELKKSLNKSLYFIGENNPNEIVEESMSPLSDSGPSEKVD
jgi:hypothetical protein